MPWWNKLWPYRKQLTFDNSAQAENLVNFTVLVKLTAANFDFSKAQSAGQDIRFVDADGVTLLAHEIEYWSATEADIWVKVPQIDASSAIDSIYMYYGNPYCDDGQNINATWNSNYALVTHMKDSPDNAHVADSTSGGLNGTKGSAGHPAQADAKIYKGQSFNGTTDLITDNGVTGASLFDGAFTIEVWASIAAWAANRDLISAGNGLSSPRHYIVLGDFVTASKKFQSQVSVVSTINTVLSLGTYNNDSSLHYFAMTVDANGKITKFVIDGVNQGSDTTNTLTPVVNKFYIGQLVWSAANVNPWQGIVDEVRVSNTERSLAWLKAQYLSMTLAFITFGSEAAVPAIGNSDFTIQIGRKQSTNVDFTEEYAVV